MIDGLLYPTVAMNGNSDNIALKSEANKKLDFISSQFVEVISKQDQKYEIKTIDTATKIDRDKNIIWSARDFLWQLEKNCEELCFQVKNGEWIAKDASGQYVDPV